MKKQIEFHLIHDFPDHIIVPPLPAKRTLPNWFKGMPGEHDGDQTVKRCVPFLDAMSVGYTLLTHIDVLLKQDTNGNLALRFTDEKHQQLINRWPPIETHPMRQIVGSPFESLTILKYMNPWVIKTPKEYSLLFLPPINRFESSIIPLVGLVDTDLYKNVVNIPFIHTELTAGGPEVFIPAGTPMCQLVPVRRDEWTSRVTWLDAGQLNETKKQRTEIQKNRLGWYKNKLHQKKDYN
jgi:hypothetical protein